MDFAVCPLVCVVPTLVDFRAVETSQLLQRVQAFISETTSYEHTPIGRISRWTGSEMKARSEEHTSELQSHSDLVCRLLLEKKKKKNKKHRMNYKPCISLENAHR